MKDRDIDQGRLRALIAEFQVRRARAREGKTHLVTVTPSFPGGGGRVLQGEHHVESRPMPPDGPPDNKIEVPFPEAELDWLLHQVEWAAAEIVRARNVGAWKGLPPAPQ